MMYRKARIAIPALALLVLALAGGTVTVLRPDGGGPDLVAYCGSLRTLLEPQTGEPGKESIERVDRLMAELVTAAPDNLRPNAEVYANAVHLFAGELAKVNYDIAAVQPEQMKVLEAPEVSKAAQAVMQSATDDCKIPSQSPTAPPEPSTVPTGVEPANPSAPGKTESPPATTR